MIYTIDELKEKILPVALKYSLPAVYIFGSYARSEANENSDVDVLIDRTGSDLKGLLKMGGLHNDLCECLGKNIDLITVDMLDQPDVTERTPWFVENLNKERIMIYERQ